MSSLKFSTPQRIDDIDSVPQLPGIYIWRKAPSDDGFFDAKQSGDPEKLKNWILTRLGSNLANWQRAEMKAEGLRANFFSFEGLSIGSPCQASISKSLSELSMAQLVDICHILIEASENYGPVIYVGQSDNLRRRLGEHVGGYSKLKQRLDEADYGFDDLVFSYLVINVEGDMDSDLISCAELVVGTTTAAFCSVRLG